MKIQCDVCDKDEASVFCVADEAALCAACDHRVHHANKLAGKHQRFSLHHPSPKQAPTCDICKERRAFLFCHQDRAILCKECDNSIHKANEHTQKHTRFLLTGVKLSSTSALYTSSSSPEESASSKNNKCTPSTAKGTTAQSSVDLKNGSINGSSSSSISEYLTEVIPGWHVEDFLDSSSPYGFSKNGENDGLPFWDGTDILETNTNNMNYGQMGLWVPQVSPLDLHQTTQNMGFGSQNAAIIREIKSNEFGFGTNNYNMKSNKKLSSDQDNSFAVPQINPHSNASYKRSRTFW